MEQNKPLGKTNDDMTELEYKDSSLQNDRRPSSKDESVPNASRGSGEYMASTKDQMKDIASKGKELVFGSGMSEQTSIEINGLPFDEKTKEQFKKI